MREKRPRRGRLAPAGESALQVPTGTDELIACVTRAHTSRLSASVAVARLALAAAADQRLQDSTYQNLPEALRTCLVQRLTQDAAERHINAGIRASQEFQALLDRRLTRPDGVRRKVATVPTGELIDRYGRLLAYLAPWFSGSASDPAAISATIPSGGPSTWTWSRPAGARSS